MPGILIPFDLPRPPANGHTCALCMPFNSCFEQLSNSITAAANKVGLNAVRIDDNRKDAQWIDRIINTLKSAKIVVGILAYEPDRPYINPNVMYEIGFSHALGKATLIMVPNDVKPPSQLAPFDYFTYDTNAVGTRSFTDALQTRLTMLLSAIGDGYVQKGLSGARFVEDSTLLLCDDSVLPHYWFLLDYVRLIRDRFYHLFANFIKPLSYSSRLMQSARRAEGSVIAFQFQDQVEAYKSEYDLTIRPTTLCSRLELGNKTADSALIALDSIIDAASFSEPTDVVRQSYELVYKYLQDFNKCHDRISVAGHDKDRIIIEIGTLEQTANRVLSHASTLNNALTAFLKPQER